MRRKLISFTMVTHTKNKMYHALILTKQLKSCGSLNGKTLVFCQVEDNGDGCCFVEQTRLPARYFRAEDRAITRRRPNLAFSCCRPLWKTNKPVTRPLTNCQTKIDSQQWLVRSLIYFDIAPPCEQKTAEKIKHVLQNYPAKNWNRAF